MSLLSNLFSVSTFANRSWCRPTHRTNCTYVIGGNACCVCVPSTATCFIIEMWGQGGGGAGSCCCMMACFGGQGGDYGWVACTTSGTTHTLCACACTCNCVSGAAGLFTGSPGQLAYVTDCSVANCYKVTNAACGGSTCCNFNWMGITCGYGMSINPAHSNLSIQCCCAGAWTNAWCYDQGASYDAPCAAYINAFSPMKTMPFYQIQGTSASLVSCNCCQCFNFYVRGGCGWSDPHQLVTYASDVACWYNMPINVYCGFGMGRGGSAYAGGAGQCCDCVGNTCMQFGGVNGNFPGGGGSSASGTGITGGCCLGSCGGLSLILISWS